jgi:hypothetical protein
VELLASVRPCSVAVSFGFFTLDETVGNEVGFRLASTAALVLLLGPGGVSPAGDSWFVEEILNLSRFMQT